MVSHIKEIMFCSNYDFYYAIVELYFKVLWNSLQTETTAALAWPVAVESSLPQNLALMPDVPIVAIAELIPPGI